MSVLEELLELQTHDTVIDQLEHRQANLEERGAVDRIDSQLAAHDLTVTECEAERHVLQREQRRLEDLVLGVEEKTIGEEGKLYGGSVTAIKELQALQEEIASLKRRQSSLEDELMEILMAIEPLDSRLAALGEDRSLQESLKAEATAALESAESGITADLASERSTRDAALQEIPEPLLAEYESLRTRMKGVAVARLNGGTCMGCHLALSAVEVDRIRKEPPDVAVHCEECGRILVR
jgi:predicted  nucleic acid-binding Zn-ribbon protein